LGAALDEAETKAVLSKCLDRGGVIGKATETQCARVFNNFVNLKKRDQKRGRLKEKGTPGSSR
jgi:hypothetical protein